MPELVSRWGSRLAPIDGLGEVSYADFALVSGRADFVASCEPLLRNIRWAYWSQGRNRRTGRLPGKAAVVSHASVGGVSTFEGTFGLVNAPSHVRLPSTVARFLKHVIKFSERADAAGKKKPAVATGALDRIAVRAVGLPIHYQTHSTRTGWGIRPLVDEERRNIFDIPSWVLNPSACLALEAPLKPFMSLARAMIESTPRTVLPTRHLGGLALPARYTTGPSISSIPGAVYLPALKRWLSADWLSGHTIAAKACRADDATKELSPWRRRIELALDVGLTAPQWRALESFVARCYRRRLILSFFSYLRFTYGEHYALRYRAVLESRLSTGHSERPRKRRKLGGYAYATQTGSIPVSRCSHPVNGDDLVADIQCGLKVLGRNLMSTTWDWDSGSSLNFWRWADVEQRRAARDGLQSFIDSALPTSAGEVKPRIKPEDKEKVYAKIVKVLRRGYVVAGQVAHLLHYFAVPKGPTDIRMVYDGTKGGFNSAQWAPSFYMPDFASSTVFLDYNSWIFDLDFGDCFLNFFQCPLLRAFSGISLRPFSTWVARDFPHLMRGKYPMHVHWSRLFMGGKASPYCAIKQIHCAEEVAVGDPSDPTNPFRYDRVILNCKGDPSFNPSKPKCMKWLDKEECIAADKVTYVDDMRGAGPDPDWSWRARDQMGKKLQYLGCQDAIRKASPPSKTPQAWIGGAVRIDTEGIYVSLPQEKWDKFRSHVDEFDQLVRSAVDSRPTMDFKYLERKLGFMSHAALTMKDFRPFLRGFYMTLNSWRHGAVNEVSFGPNTPAEEPPDAFLGQMEQMAHAHATSVTWGERPPPGTLVKAVSRFADDVAALKRLVNRDTPTERCIRHRNMWTLVYGFTDASGTGGGASFSRPVESHDLSARISVWEGDDELESSNWKEFCKLVLALEDEAANGSLKHTLITMFTDNSTVESAIHAGRSSSPRLHALVIRFLALQTMHDCEIEVVHVAGTRMIAQGTDGISRGALNEGVMDGASMLSFVPLHLSALDRSALLKDWLLSWLPGSPIFLSPMDWFQKGQGISGWVPNFEGIKVPQLLDPAVLVWTPPPYAADVAIAELRKSRHKRTHHTHVFVCPRLCTPLWRRQFYRAADIVIEIPPSRSYWDSDMYEPLLIGIVFPFIRYAPWQLRATPKMFAMARDVRRMFKDNEVDPGDLLRKFCLECWKIRTMPEELVRRMLFFEPPPNIPSGRDH